MQSARHRLYVAMTMLMIVFLCTGEARAGRKTSLIVIADSAKRVESVPQMTLTKSPTGAILRSIVFPGWGQLYNESYWKAGLFAGATLSITGILLWNDSKYADALSRFNALDSTDVLRSRTYREKEFYRDQRDVTGLWLLGIYTLAAVDAYVGAHLFDFDVSEKGLSALPLVGRDQVGLCVMYTF